MKKKLLSNILFIIIFVVLALAFIKKDQSIEISIISEPDGQLIFSTGDVLEQTWQSNVKKISGIVVPYSAIDSFEGEIKAEVVSDDGESVIAESVQKKNFLEGESSSLTFSWRPVSVDLGVRYRIRLYCASTSDEGSFSLPASSNYGGCHMNGEEVNQAAGLTVGGVKTSSFFFLIIASFPFFSLALLFMLIWKRKWEDTIGVSFILFTLVMVFTGMCGILNGSIYFIYILAVLSFFTAVWIYNRNECQLRDLLSPGLLVFAVLFLFVIANCNSLYVSRADEFSFWSLAVKDMYCFDSLTKHADTVVLHTYYPPFMLCIEYFWTYVNGFFSDKIVYIGCQMMLVSCLVVACKTAVKKRKLIFPAVASIFAVPLFFYEDIFSTLYTDAALAVFVAYILICYFTEELSGFNIMRIVCGLAALTYIKPTGVVLSGLITLMILGDVFCKQRQSQKLCLKKLWIPCSFMTLVVLLYAIWQVYLKIPVKTDQLSAAAIGVTEKTVEAMTTKTITSVSGITFKNIMDFLLLKGDPYRYEVLKQYLKTMLVGESFSIGSLSFSYLEMLLLFFLLVWLFAKSFEETSRRDILRFGVFSCLAGIGYSIFLLTTYLFSFSEQEAMRLAHIERYLASWICGIFIAFLVLVIYNLAESKENKRQRTDICIFLIMMLLVIAPTEKLLDRRSDRNHMEQYAYGYEKTAEAARSFADRSEQIYFVGEQDSGYMFAYALCPMRVSFSAEVPDASEWGSELQDYQYVFLMNVDEEFKEKYEGVFEEPGKIADASFYKVKEDGSHKLLQYIGTTKAMRNLEE